MEPIRKILLFRLLVYYLKNKRFIFALLQEIKVNKTRTKAQASVLQPEGRNKQAPLGEWETARGGRGSSSIKMGRGEELWSRNPRSELVLVSPNCRNERLTPLPLKNPRILTDEP